MPITFRIENGSIIAQTSVRSVTDGRELSLDFVSKPLKMRMNPSAVWFLGLARWVYLHELDEWWTSSSGRTRNPHLCEGLARWPLTYKRWEVLATLFPTEQNR